MTKMSSEFSQINVCALGVQSISLPIEDTDLSKSRRQFGGLGVVHPKSLHRPPAADLMGEVWRRAWTNGEEMV